MVSVEFLGPINKDIISLDIYNLSQLSDILKEDNEVKAWLKDCAVAINDKLVCTQDIKLNNGDKISILPPVCGG